MSTQGVFTKGIYEFEDPSGALMAAKIPVAGTADLYSGTRILVKPNQCAIFVYNGAITDILEAGNHEVKTENLPVITRLANWQFNFESPLRCEIIFVSGQIFTARRWGTAQPAILNLGAGGNIPIRGYGNYNLWVWDPAKFYTSLVGTKSTFDASEVEDFIQGQILEVFPQALQVVKDIKDLNASQDQVSHGIEDLVNIQLKKYGLKVGQLKTVSLQPPQEVLRAMDEKLAMQVIGNQKQYMLYKMASSFDAVKQQGTDPMHMMMGLMVGKGLLGFDDQEKQGLSLAPPLQIACEKCGCQNTPGSNFCTSCGNRLSP